jgi:hypothetical protein
MHAVFWGRKRTKVNGLQKGILGDYHRIGDGLKFSKTGMLLGRALEPE